MKQVENQVCYRVKVENFKDALGETGRKSSLLSLRVQTFKVKSAIKVKDREV